MIRDGRRDVQVNSAQEMLADSLANLLNALADFVRRTDTDTVLIGVFVLLLIIVLGGGFAMLPVLYHAMK